MNRETFLANMEFLRNAKASYPYPLATKKVGAPSAQDILRGIPGLDFKRVPFYLHIWWAFKSKKDRQRFEAYLGYDVAKHHPNNLIALDSME